LLPGVARHLRKALWTEISGLVIFSIAMIVAAFLPWPWR
jgi:hypothetical protein